MMHVCRNNFCYCTTSPLQRKLWKTQTQVWKSKPALHFVRTQCCSEKPSDLQHRSLHALAQINMWAHCQHQQIHSYMTNFYQPLSGSLCYPFPVLIFMFDWRNIPKNGGSLETAMPCNIIRRVRAMEANIGYFRMFL